MNNMEILEIQNILNHILDDIENIKRKLNTSYNMSIYKTKNNRDETGGYDVDLCLYSSGLPKIENANSSGSKINKTIYK